MSALSEQNKTKQNKKKQKKANIQVTWYKNYITNCDSNYIITFKAKI